MTKRLTSIGVSRAVAHSAIVARGSRSFAGERSGPSMRSPG